MTASHPALALDWLGACRRAAEGLRSVLRDHPTSRERVVETGDRGGGGDLTLVIDAEAEGHVFAELQRLYDEGARFTAVFEERGVVDFGDPNVLVIVDPIDGSVNAKRGLPYHALSIAVADGPTMADVAFGYVCDLGGEEWHAVRGEGAYLNGRPIVDPPPERRAPDGRLEVVALEMARPRHLARCSEQLIAAVQRVRVIGSLAISLCQVAAARVDGAVSLMGTRAVDTAAAQLIVRESGGHVAFVGADEPLAAPLDLEPRYPVVAARTAESLERLAAVPVV